MRSVNPLMTNSDAFSPSERKEIFITELLKSGVEPQQAIRAAAILATELSDEQLTSEQIQLVKEACEKWLKARKRQEFIDSVLREPVD